MENANRRRKYLIEKEFQFGMYFKFLAIVSFACLLTFLTIFIFNFRQNGFNSEILINSTLALVLSEVILSIVTAVYVLFYSHKMAGPIYRFKKMTEEVSKDNLNYRVRIREGDEFQELANSLDEMLKELSEKKYSGNQESRYDKFGEN